MTKNKSYNIQTLCKLRDIDPDSEEGKKLFDMSILDLLIAIRTERNRKETEICSITDSLFT